MLERVIMLRTGPLILGLLFLPVTTLGYFVIAGASHILLRFVFRSHFEHRYLNRHRPTAEDLRREIFNSLRTFVIFDLVLMLFLWGHKAGLFRLYFSIRERGTAYFLLSIVLLVILDDALYYWMHRLMHHPVLYKRVHAAHHKTLNPTPWASFSFGAWEAGMLSSFIPIVALFMPMHPLAAVMAFIIQMFHNVAGHSAHELVPQPLVKLLCANTVAKHQAHHEKFNGNYSLHFQWWDKLMGTRIPGTPARGVETSSAEERHSDRSVRLAG